jgi:hypothetical protein
MGLLLAQFPRAARRRRARRGGVTSEALTQMREGLISALDSIHVASRIFDPTDLIRYIDDLALPFERSGR